MCHKGRQVKDRYEISNNDVLAGIPFSAGLPGDAVYRADNVK